MNFNFGEQVFYENINRDPATTILDAMEKLQQPPASDTHTKKPEGEKSERDPDAAKPGADDEKSDGQIDS